MPKLFLVLKVSLIIIFIFFSGIYGILRIKYAQQLKYLSAKATIERDQFNIPHVVASSRNSAFYAWGYTVAEDRLFQLALRRIMLVGRLSELFGQQSLKYDKLFRQLNFRYWADQSAEYLKQTNFQDYEAIKAYAEGINDFVKNSLFLPIDFYIVNLDWQEWTVSDIYLLYKVMELSQSQNAGQQYVRSSLLKNFTKQQIDNFIPYDYDNFFINNSRTLVRDDEIADDLINRTIPLDRKQFTPIQVQQMLKVGMATFATGLTFGAGSNSWAISGKHTESGHPIVANDPHLHNAMPGQWRQIRLSYQVNGKLYNGTGSANPGLPILIGQFDYVAVAFTTNHADTQDLYNEKIQGEKYLLDGEWKDLKKRIQLIKIKGQDKPLEYVVYETHRGPIIHYLIHIHHLYEIKNQNISLAWGGFRIANSSFNNFTRFIQVETYEQFLNMVHQFGTYTPAMVINYITKDDHYGAQSIGPSVLRRNPQYGAYVKDGTSSEYDWIGILPSKSNIYVRDPERGFIVHANNMLNSKFQNGMFRVSIATARAERIQRMIQQKINKGQKFTIQDMKRMQLDTVDFYCTQIIGHLSKILGKENLLVGFDCNMTKDSYQASVYESFIHQLKKNFVKNSPYNNYNLGVSYHFHQYILKYIFKQQQETKQIRLSYDEALKFLGKYFSTTDFKQWKWGSLHKTYHPHRPFSKSKLLKTFYQRENQGQGNNNTPNIGLQNMLCQDDFRNYHHANLRQIMSFYQDTFWIVDGGTSERFYSKHYDDQQKLHIQGKYLRMSKFNSLGQKLNISQEQSQQL